jgi:DNA invertase Pin-like site-specific DNA recombinase
MRIAAIYARVSSEQQREEHTIASQTAALIEFAKSHDLEVPKDWVFEDEGFSGAILERPGLERVRDLAAEAQIQVVLAYAPDRLSRKYPRGILTTTSRSVTTDTRNTIKIGDRAHPYSASMPPFRRGAHADLSPAFGAPAIPVP